MGSVEHLRGALDAVGMSDGDNGDADLDPENRPAREGSSTARCVGAGELVWMTDRTPHESLPLRAGTRRQYFRLVTGPVSGWFERHSTRNPAVSDADLARAGVVVIREDKFECW